MSYSVIGRRWFQKSAGNTYHTVSIFRDGELLAELPREYGYGEQYIQTAKGWMQKNGHLVGLSYGDFCRAVTYSVTDVQRKKDL